MAFLRNGVDARAAILGQAVTSLVEDPSACYWNPAGLPRVDGSQALLCHVESFADLRHEYAALTQPIGFGMVGLSFHGVWTDNIPGYDAQGRPTASFGYSDYEAGVAWGAAVGRGCTVGAGWKYLRSDIGQYSASGWAVDLGVQWVLRHELPLRCGLAVRNVGPAMHYLVEEFDLPLTIQGGVSWTRELARLDGELTLAADLKHARDDGTSLLWGAEYAYRQLLSFGVGYQGGWDTRDVSLGLGAHVGRLTAHWAYVPFDADLGDEHRVSVRIRI